MSTTIGRMTDIGQATRAYPELIEAAKSLLLDGLRSAAREAGFDVSTETDLTWPEPIHYRFDVDEDENKWTMVEVPVEDAAYTRFIVEATYEESTSA